MNKFKRQIANYTGLLLISSWVIQFFAIQVTGDINSDAARIWLIATMLSPLVVTIIFLSKNKELTPLILWKPNTKIVITSFLAVLIPILIAFAVLSFIQFMNYGHSNWFQLVGTKINITNGPFLLGKGEQAWYVFVVNIFLTGFLFAILNGFIATGEEFAWRGLLQPMMTRQFGLVKGVFLLGFVWAIWHLPVLLAGYNYPDNPLLGSFVLFPIRLIATSYFYVWLTQKCNSFIPASISHGALNGIQTAVISSIAMTSPQLVENVITIAFSIIAGIVFLVLSLKSEKDKSITA